MTQSGSYFPRANISPRAMPIPNLIKIGQHLSKLPKIPEGKSRSHNPIGFIFFPSYFFTKGYVHSKFHQNRSIFRHSSHTNSRSYPKAKAEVMTRSHPFSIPIDSSPKPIFWFLFHQNRLRFTQVMRCTSFCLQRTGYRVQGTGYRVQGTGYRVQRTAYTLHRDTDPP